jgi:hypothetical protein
MPGQTPENVLIIHTQDLIDAADARKRELSPEPNSEGQRYYASTLENFIIASTKFDKVVFATDLPEDIRKDLLQRMKVMPEEAAATLKDPAPHRESQKFRAKYITRDKEIFKALEIALDSPDVKACKEIQKDSANNYIFGSMDSYPGAALYRENSPKFPNIPVTTPVVKVGGYTRDCLEFGGLYDQAIGEGLKDKQITANDLNAICEELQKEGVRLQKKMDQFQYTDQSKFNTYKGRMEIVQSCKDNLTELAGKITNKQAAVMYGDVAKKLGTLKANSTNIPPILRFFTQFLGIKSEGQKNIEKIMTQQKLVVPTPPPNHIIPRKPGR